MSSTFRRFLQILAMVVFGLVFATQLAFADDNLMEKLQVVYDQQCSNLIRNDFDSWTKSMAPTFSLLTAEGVSKTRDELVANTKKGAELLEITSCTATIRDVYPQGDLVKVVVTNSADGAIKSASGNDLIRTESDSIDVWRRSGEGFLEISSTDIDGTLIVNGAIRFQHRLPAKIRVPPS